MYTIYANETVLHNANLAIDGYLVENPQFRSELNAHGSGSFNLPPSNPRYNDIESRTTTIRVTDGSTEIWRGRVLSVKRGLNGVKSVYCEGELAYLTDSLQRPLGFKGSPEALLRLLIEDTSRGHNAEVDDSRKFYVGNVTVTDPNDLIVRSWSSADNTWKIIKQKLLDMLGGYLLVRQDGNRRVVDYVASIDQVASQGVTFGENLIDMTEDVSAANIITCLIPYGATYEQDDPNYRDKAPENGTWTGNRLTINSVNNNVDCLKADGTGDFIGYDGKSIYGEVWGTKIWEDVTVASNLKTKGIAYLKEQLSQSISVNAKAVDLSLIDEQVSQIPVGKLVSVRVHDNYYLLPCTAKTTHLTRPDQTQLTIGADILTISKVAAGRNK